MAAFLDVRCTCSVLEGSIAKRMGFPTRLAGDSGQIQAPSATAQPATPARIHAVAREPPSLELVLDASESLEQAQENKANSGNRNHDVSSRTVDLNTLMNFSRNSTRCTVVVSQPNPAHHEQ